MNAAVAAEIVNRGLSQMGVSHAGTPLGAAFDSWATRSPTGRWPLVAALEAAEPIARSLSSPGHHFHMRSTRAWIAGDSVCLEQAVLLAMLSVCELLSEGGRVRVTPLAAKNGHLPVVFVGARCAFSAPMRAGRRRLLAEAAEAAGGRFHSFDYVDGCPTLRIDLPVAKKP